METRTVLNSSRRTTTVATWILPHAEQTMMYRNRSGILRWLILCLVQ